MQLQIREFDMRGGDENTTGQRQTWQWVMVFGGRIDYLKERLVSSLLRAPVYRWLGTSGWHWSLRLPQGLWTGWWSLAVLWEKAVEKEKGERVRHFQCAPKKLTLVSFVVEQWGSHLDGKKNVSLDFVPHYRLAQEKLKCYHVWLCCCRAIHTLTQGGLTECLHSFHRGSWPHPKCGWRNQTPLRQLGFCWVKTIYFKW